MKQNEPNRISTAVFFLAVLALIHVPGHTAGQQRTDYVNPAGETPESGQKQSPIEDERRIVQESSQRIAELVRRRPTTITPNDDQRLIQKHIDLKIAEIQHERAQALEAVVLVDNPEIQSTDRERGCYRVPVKDGEGQIHWFSARIPAIWHLHRLDPAVFTLAESIRAKPQSVELPPDTRVMSHLLIGGTSAQSRIQPYPGDIDYNETYDVRAPTPAAAAEAMAAIIAEYVSRTARDPKLEFDALRIMPLKFRRTQGADYHWSRERILDLSQRSELATQLTSVDSGRVNTDWRALVSDGRYIVIGKILGITALSSVSSEHFFVTEPLRLDFQVLYFGDEVPPTHRDIPLGDYASHMRARTNLRIKRKHSLKAAKRAFNFCRAVGDLDCIDAVTPIFATPEAEVYHNYKVLEAIAMALNPQTPSRILLAANARDQILKAAAAIEANLPVVPGTLPERPKAVAGQLRDIASAIRARNTYPVGVVVADAKLAKRMKTLLDVELISIVRLSLEDRAEKIVGTFVR